MDEKERRMLALKKASDGDAGPGGHIPDGTGPHGRGMGPGQGKADGSGRPKQGDPFPIITKAEDYEKLAAGSFYRREIGGIVVQKPSEMGKEPLRKIGG